VEDYGLIAIGKKDGARVAEFEAAIEIEEFSPFWCVYFRIRTNVLSAHLIRLDVPREPLLLLSRRIGGALAGAQNVDDTTAAMKEQVATSS
jgi:hypothetical protein